MVQLSGILYYLFCHIAWFKFITICLYVIIASRYVLFTFSMWKSLRVGIFIHDGEHSLIRSTNLILEGYCIEKTCFQQKVFETARKLLLPLSRCIRSKCIPKSFETSNRSCFGQIPSQSWKIKIWIPHYWPAMKTVKLHNSPLLLNSLQPNEMLI